MLMINGLQISLQNNINFIEFQPQQSQMLPLDINAWSQNSPKIDTSTWKSVNQTNNKSTGFMLHQNNGGMPKPHDRGIISISLNQSTSIQ